MRTALIGLIISITLILSGYPIKKESRAVVVKPVVEQKIERVNKPANITPRPFIDYTYVSPNLYFNYEYHMYYYREIVPSRIITERKYRFPVLGRVLRTRIDIRGPEGRGVNIGLGSRRPY